MYKKAARGPTIRIRSSFYISIRFDWTISKRFRENTNNDIENNPVSRLKIKFATAGLRTQIILRNVTCACNQIFVHIYIHAEYDYEMIA